MGVKGEIMSEVKTKQELLDRANEILENGGSFTRVHNYLHNNCEDEVLIKQVAKEAITLDDNRKQFEQKETGYRIPFNMSILLGSIFLVGGVFYAGWLWNKGAVGILPFLFIVIGLFGIADGARK